MACVQGQAELLIQRAKSRFGGPGSPRSQHQDCEKDERLPPHLGAPASLPALEHENRKNDECMPGRLALHNPRLKADQQTRSLAAAFSCSIVHSQLTRSPQDSEALR